MANNHNNGPEHSQPASQCLCHAFLSEPRPEFKLIKTQVDVSVPACVFVCVHESKVETRPTKRTYERVNEQTNERAYRGLHLVLQIYTCVYGVELNEKKQNRTEQNASNNGLAWKYNRMTSSFVNMLLLQLLLMLLSLPQSSPTLPSALLLPQLICV